jgi:hypothetical protein
MPLLQLGTCTNCYNVNCGHLTQPIFAKTQPTTVEMDLTALVVKSNVHSSHYGIYLPASTRLLNNHALLEDIFRVDLMNSFIHHHSGRIQEAADVPVHLGGKAWNEVERGLC